MAEILDQSYSPKYAPHVKGRYSRMTVEDGVRQPQIVEILCESCGARYRNECKQGQPRQHVARFATLHLHRHPLAPVPSGGSTTASGQ